MRVITGEARGRKLITVEGTETGNNNEQEEECTCKLIEYSRECNSCTCL